MENKINTGVDAVDGAAELDGAALLDNLSAYIRCYVVVSEAQARVIALWVIHTHAFAAADCTPYLSINSPEKQSGKTRLLEVLDTVTAKPWLTGRVTAAVLTRVIDAKHPTLLLDESDAAFNGEREYAETLRGTLNSGYREGGKVSCCVGPNHDAKDFSTFCPKAIAGIGRLPDTVGDRSIPIRLKRAARGEHVEKFRRREVEPIATELRDMVSVWCGGIAEQLREARPELPEELTDRQQDGAEPLLAIADAAGGDWPQQARKAVVALCAEARKNDASIGVRLLSDIRQIFDERRVDRLFSVDLAKWLAEIETSPWAEWKGEKPITPPKVARLLDGFDIQPRTIRIGRKTLKGYVKADFDGEWRRYLPPSESEWLAASLPPSPPLQTVTPSQAAKNAGSREFQAVTNERGVTFPKREIANKNAGCDGVTVRRPTRGRRKPK